MRDIYLGDERQSFDIKNKEIKEFIIEDYWSAEGLGEDLEKFRAEKKLSEVK